MKIFLTFIVSLWASYCIGQYKITGSVVDQNNQALTGATVVLIETSDSTMVEFCLTNNKGEFVLNDVSKGVYAIQLSFISFESQTVNLMTDWDEKDIQLDPFILKESSEVLKEIEVKAEHIPMGLRGDTISYNASAFKTRPNATAEDLLKKLPGIEVARDGSIKAMGKDVEQVLVDGKEFFGNDPKMATKNLPAEAIDKVEVYDKQNEVEAFTGIDDGQESQTIDLKLKEDHKNGGFGGLDIARGSENTYSAKANYMRFSPKVQASFLGASNNINNETFTINDYISFMGGIGNVMSGGNLNFSDYQPLQNGINESTSIGSNLNWDINAKVDINAHYLFNEVNNDIQSNNSITNLGEGFLFDQFTTSMNMRQNNSHKLSTKIKYKINPLTHVNFKNIISFSSRNSTNDAEVNYVLMNQNVGNSLSDFISDGDEFSFAHQTTLKRKSKKKGRNWISNFRLKKVTEDIFDNVFNSNQVQGQDILIDQNQYYKNELSQIGGDINFTEPLGSNFYLSLSYAYDRSYDRPFRNFFDLESGQEILNKSLSSDYERIYKYHVAGFNLKRNRKRLKINVGTKYQWTALYGSINDGEFKTDQLFTNILPYFNTNLKTKGRGSLDFTYNTNIIAPTLQQLLPLPNNTTPNFEFIGNPELVPQYDHRLSLGYNLFDNFSLTSLFANVRYTNSNNRIVYKNSINDQLFRRSTPVNTDKYEDINTYVSLSRPFRPLKLKYRLTINYRYADYNSFLNDLESPVKESSTNLKFSLRNKNTEHVYIETGVDWSRTNQQFEIADDLGQTFSSTNFFVDSDLYLPLGFTLTSKVNFNRFSSEGFNDQPNFILWNAAIKKLLLKDKLELRLEAFDILNQNIGYRRVPTATSIREESYNNLSQYFMFGLNYRIGNNKMDSGIQLDIQ